MLVLIHVTIALASIAYTGLTFFAPSKLRIRLSQILTALTLISGTYLVISMKANMLKACMSGLIYLAVVSFGIAAAGHKLASEQNKTD